MTSYPGGVVTALVADGDLQQAKTQESRQLLIQARGLADIDLAAAKLVRKIDPLLDLPRDKMTAVGRHLAAVKKERPHAYPKTGIRPCSSRVCSTTAGVILLIVSFRLHTEFVRLFSSSDYTHRPHDGDESFRIGHTSEPIFTPVPKLILPRIPGFDAPPRPTYSWWRINLICPREFKRMAAYPASHLNMFDDENARQRARLAERHKRIIDANLDCFSGKTVLDLASNNGRWSYAASCAGAKEVVSVEGRSDRVDHAKRIFTEIGIDDRIEAHVGDMFDWLYENRTRQVDTILCLGVFYHIMDHHRLLKLMVDVEPNTIIIDSGFVRSLRDVIHVIRENPNRHSNALPSAERQRRQYVGLVSLGLLIRMSWDFGYSCRPVPWDPAKVENRDAVSDYLRGRRFTVRLEKNVRQTDWKNEWGEVLGLLHPRFPNLLDPAEHDRIADDRNTTTVPSSIIDLQAQPEAHQGKGKDQDRPSTHVIRQFFKR